MTMSLVSMVREVLREITSLSLALIRRKGVNEAFERTCSNYFVRRLRNLRTLIKASKDTPTYTHTNTYINCIIIAGDFIVFAVDIP